MTNGYSDIQKTDIPSENFNIPAINAPRYYQTRLRFVSHHDGSIGTLCKILKRLANMDFPGKDHVAAYLRHLTHRNRRPRTLESRFGAIVLFLGMIRDSGKTCLEEVTRRDVEAFIEQDEPRERSSLPPLSGGGRDCFPGYFQQEDPVAVAGAAAAGHGP
jgi:hypothetical protein